MAVRPHATDDSFTFSEHDAIGGNLLANDSPGPGGLYLRAFDGVTVKAKQVGQVTDIAGDYGTFHVKADGSFTYDLYDWAKVGFNAGDQYVEKLNYKISDGLGATDVGTFTLTVNGFNERPIAVPDVINFNEHDSISGNILANDIPSSYSPNLYLRAFNNVTVAQTGVTDVNGAYGTFHVKADGSFTYDLTNPDVADNTTLTETIKYYKITDGLGHADVDTVTLHIHGDVVAV